MRKWIAFLLILTMMLSVCACGGVDGGAMTLTEQGTVPGSVHFGYSGFVVEYDGTEADRVKILNQNGVAFNDNWYDAVHAVVSEGVCVVKNGKLLGVVDSVAEKELLPCEASDILRISDRYLLLRYNRGSNKILDLEKGRVVPGLEATGSNLEVSAFGNMIVLADEGLKSRVYNAEGTLVGTYERIVGFSESDLAMQYTADGVCIYDKDMKLVNTLPRTDSNEHYDPIEGTSEMLIHEFSKDGSTCYCVIDIATGKALSQEYPKIMGVNPEGFISVVQGDDTQIVDFKGNVIISGHANYLEPGYFIQPVGAGVVLYDTTGKKLSENVFTQKDELLLTDSAGRIFIYETGELLTVEGNPQLLTGSLVYAGDKVYDLISGKVVLEGVDSCVATGDSIYVYNKDNDQYTRYIAKFN